MKPTHTINLYGGEEGRTLYPDKTYYRPNVHIKPSLARDVADICLGAVLLFVLYFIVWLLFL